MSDFFKDGFFRAMVFLKALRDIYQKENNTNSVDVDAVVELLCDLKEENLFLSNKVSELEYRLQATNWAFGGSIR
jgi:hypothetical protein